MTQEAPQAQRFAGRADADKAAVAGALQAQGIGHTSDPVTGALTVDADKLYQARIALAGQGLPKAQPSGDPRLDAERLRAAGKRAGEEPRADRRVRVTRSEEHTSELQSLMRISYAVFCLKKKKRNTKNKKHTKNK